MIVHLGEIITPNIINLNQRLCIGETPIILEAVMTVKGLVIALAKPNPQATMHIRNPV